MFQPCLKHLANHRRSAAAHHENVAPCLGSLHDDINELVYLDRLLAEECNVLLDIVRDELHGTDEDVLIVRRGSGLLFPSIYRGGHWASPLLQEAGSP
jgi:hypothetical protein